MTARHEELDRITEKAVESVEPRPAQPATHQARPDRPGPPQRPGEGWRDPTAERSGPDTVDETVSPFASQPMVDRGCSCPVEILRLVAASTANGPKSIVHHQVRHGCDSDHSTLRARNGPYTDHFDACAGDWAGVVSRGISGVVGTMRPETSIEVVQLPERSPPPLQVTWKTSEVPPTTSIGETQETRLSPMHIVERQLVDRDGPVHQRHNAGILVGVLQGEVGELERRAGGHIDGDRARLPGEAAGARQLAEQRALVDVGLPWVGRSDRRHGHGVVGETAAGTLTTDVDEIAAGSCSVTASSATASRTAGLTIPNHTPDERSNGGGHHEQPTEQPLGNHRCLHERDRCAGRGAARLIGVDRELHGARPALPLQSVGVHLEADQRAGARLDTSGRRIEVAVDPACWIEEVQPARGLGVALVLEHHLVDRGAPGHAAPAAACAVVE